MVFSKSNVGDIMNLYDVKEYLEEIQEARYEKSGCWLKSDQKMIDAVDQAIVNEKALELLKKRCNEVLGNWAVPCTWVEDAIEQAGDLV
jgi:ferredoxin-thioredoxin reductase catalytic subunit